MGLFNKKPQKKPKPAAATPPAENVAAKKAATALFTDAYKKDLRQLGREYFTEIVEGEKEALQRELSRTFVEAGNDLRGYIRRQFSSSVDYVRQELARTLADELAEHRRLLHEAEETAKQSLARSEQELSTRYSDLTRLIEEQVAAQQAKMQTIFEENERQLEDIRQKQQIHISRLDKAATAAELQSDNFSKKLAELSKRHDDELTELLVQEKQHLGGLSTKQAAALESLEKSAQAMEERYASFSETLDGAVERQKEKMLGAFSQNFARVVEQYVLGALGDEFTVKDQLPSIIKRLEADKETIMEDAKL